MKKAKKRKERGKVESKRGAEEEKVRERRGDARRKKLLIDSRRVMGGEKWLGKKNEPKRGDNSLCGRD